MAARWTARRLTGIALASLCLSAGARAQVGYVGPMVGCFGVVCVPVVSLGTYSVPGFTVPGLLSNQAFVREGIPGQFVGRAFTGEIPGQGFGRADLASNRVRGDDDVQGDEHGRRDRDDHGNRGGKSHESHLNPGTFVYGGLAFTALVSVLNSSSVASATPVAGSSEVTLPTAAPVNAHIEFASATALAATPDLVVTPEPMTLTLIATGLVALGLVSLARRRRRSNG